MKSFKLSLVVVALIGAVTLSAFTQRGLTNSNLVDVWFEFVGDPTSSDDLKDPQMYDKYDSQPSDIKAECPNADVLCAVRLPDNGTEHPSQVDLDAIQTAIATAQATNTESTNIELFD